MQIGQVPIQFVPEAPVNDIRAVTMEADVTDSLIPSLAPLAPEVVAVAPDCFFCDATRVWLAAGAAFIVLWAMRKGR